MDSYPLEKIRSLMNANSVEFGEQIQPLWSGYGSIFRCALKGASVESVIVKFVSLPDQIRHPRGWNTQKSHDRKVQSYEVELAWYKEFSAGCDEDCRVPRCYAQEALGSEFLLILEDLDSNGFNQRRIAASLDDARAGLSWLAHFHAHFMMTEPVSLWSEGCYWHLQTRPDELAALSDKRLKHFARDIEDQLRLSPFQTLVHGDAKLANFCFSEAGTVAAVDFQYVGGGCGMKDVAYFIGSCFLEEECESLERTLLDHYFDCLRLGLEKYHPLLNTADVESSWRPLYRYALADFYRFLKGWSPDHWKLHRYSEGITEQVLQELERSVVNSPSESSNFR